MPHVLVCDDDKLFAALMRRALQQRGHDVTVAEDAKSAREALAAGAFDVFVCDIVLPDQFVDRTKRSLEHTFFGRGIVAHIAFAEPICEELRVLLLESSSALKARVHNGGVYVNMEGPAFSTRAESVANHKAGFDVIGMTNLGEARCAREAEIAYATMAMVTDYDCWKVDEAHVTVDMVIENLHRNAAQAKAILTDVVPRIPKSPDWPCHSALKNAIMTDRKFWPARTVKELRLLIAKYL